MRTLYRAIVIGALCLSGVPAISQTQPAIQKPNAQVVIDIQPSIGPMRVRQLAAFGYLYVTRNTTLNTIGPTVDAEIAKLLAAMKAHGIGPVGPPVLIYHNMRAIRTRNSIWTSESKWRTVRLRLRDINWRTRRLPIARRCCLAEAWRIWGKRTKSCSRIFRPAI